MSVVLLITACALLALPGVGASTGAGLRPTDWARLSAASLWLGFRALQLGLFLAAAPAVLRSVGVHAVADACHRVFGPPMAGGALAGWASAVVLAAATVQVHRARARGARLRRLARVERWLGDHRWAGDVAVVVLPTDEVVAYAVPGSPPQVVVSERLVAVLAPDELDAVVHHELAHLRHRHDRYLMLAAVVDDTLGFVPGVRASTQVLRLAVERWADEAAAAGPGARDTVRRALVKTTQTILGPVGIVPAFTSACTIVERLAALDAEPPDPTLPQRGAAVAPVLGLATIVAACLVLWSVYAHHAFVGIFGYCPL